MYAEPTELTAQVSALLAGEAAPSSAALLQLALLCLQTGHPDQATRLRCSGQLSAEHLAELQSLESCDPLSLYTSWKAAASNGWQAALTPDALLEEGAQLAIFDLKVSAEQIAADLGVEALVGSEGEGCGSQPRILLPPFLVRMRCCCSPSGSSSGSSLGWEPVKPRKHYKSVQMYCGVVGMGRAGRCQWVGL